MPTNARPSDVLVNESPECRQAVEEIRTTIEWLREQLHDEQASRTCPVATVNHRLIQQTLLQSIVPQTPWWRRRAYQLAGLAALLLVGVTVSLKSVMPIAGFQQTQLTTRHVVEQRSEEDPSQLKQLLGLKPMAPGKRQPATTGRVDEFASYKVALNSRATPLAARTLTELGYRGKNLASVSKRPSRQNWREGTQPSARTRPASRRGPSGATRRNGGFGSVAESDDHRPESNQEYPAQIPCS